MRRHSALSRRIGTAMKIETLNSVDSTNEYIKRYIQDREDVAVFADVQTGGKGTKGRSFLSDMGGVYCSILTFYTDMVSSNSFLIMAHAAVAVCRTAEEYGVAPEIKWPNDVRAAERKLAGILIENGLKGDHVDYSVVGIGMNVSNDLSSLNGIAVGMKELLSSVPSVAEVRAKLLGNYLRPSTFGEYLSYIRFLGKEIDVAEGEFCYCAIARGILPDGRLEVERDGKQITLSSAEITLRTEQDR